MATLIDEIVEGLSSNPLRNLELAACVLARHTEADACLIVGLDNGRFEQVAAWGGAGFIPYPPAFERAVRDKRGAVYTGGALEKKHGLRSVMCLPIVVSYGDTAYLGERRQKIDAYSQVSSFLYFQIIAGGPGFPEDLLQECGIVINLLANCLEYHRIVQEASLDALTGVLNRKYLDAALEDCFFDAKAERSIFSIILLDIDYFKNVNDVYGHRTGDDVLRAISAIVASGLGKDDVLGRYGGEEFMILLRGADSGRALQTAEFLRERIYAARILDKRRELTASFGAACYPQHATSLKNLVERADKALYMAKSSGRNRSELWRDDFSGLELEKAHKQQDFFTGDSVKDANRVLSLYKMMEAACLGVSHKERAGFVLQEALVKSGAASIRFFRVNGQEIIENMSAVMPGSTPLRYNRSAIRQAVETKKPFHMVDWYNDQIITTSEFADWQSIAVAPALRRGELKGVLYAEVSIRDNVFKDDELSYLSNVATILASIL